MCYFTLLHFDVYIYMSLGIGHIFDATENILTEGSQTIITWK